MKVYVAILCLFLVGCDHIDYRLKVFNSSMKTVSVFIEKDSVGRIGKNYLKEPYKIDSDGKEKLKYFEFISPNDTLVLSQLGYWDRSDNFNSQGNLYLFVIDSINIHKHLVEADLDSLVRRYRISLNELRNQEWVVNVR